MQTSYFQRKALAQTDQKDLDMSNVMVPMPLELLKRVSALWPADMEDDGSGRIGWKAHIRQALKEFRAAFAEDVVQRQQAAASPISVQLEPVETSSAEAKLIEVATVLQGLASFLDDTAQKRRPARDHDLTGDFEAANITSVSKMAGWQLTQLKEAQTTLADQISGLMGVVQAQSIQGPNTQIKQLQEQLEALQKVPPLYQAVNRAAGELPAGWQITLGIEFESGSVELSDADGVKVEFDTCNERLDRTVLDALEAAKALHAQRGGARKEGLRQVKFESVAVGSEFKEEKDGHWHLKIDSRKGLVRYSGFESSPTFDLDEMVWVED